MALYTSRIVYPFNETITSGTSNDFTAVISGGSCVAYRLYVKNASTDAVAHDSTKVSITTLYDGDTLTVSVPSLSAANYYWYILLYWDGTSNVTSGYYPFTASGSPSISFSPTVPATITTPSYTFIGAYSQSENVSIKYFNMSLYASDGTTLLDTSGDVYSQNVRYAFNGLISGKSYKVQITGMTSGNVSFSTALTSFVVDYTVPSALNSPTATVQNDSSVVVDWGNVQSIIATISGSSSYTSNWIYTGNYALNLAAGATATFTFDFSAPFTAMTNWQPPSGAFTGDIFQVENTSGTDVVKLGFNGSQFYLNNNGAYQYISHTLTTNKYLLGIRHNGAYLNFRFKVVA